MFNAYKSLLYLIVKFSKSNPGIFASLFNTFSHKLF